ncbi:hypothetical protein [Flavilitoribacter nigricans]|uniref:Uncharacterized protein n=1 Tax=Flavilitoribacter nigricans (strain ATCC 23147 / DSM 23189 / NBRC 102662 / NCIMB 1420 / SS-2) TaxID=1122177 RepID=A0A2D0N7Z7_FLAN2|nr:hypothetical protein [Flavilitoribacter nigricans]PHN04615.1 hypothetical protein CRP01_21675 [Flavilitoribacter nigricans DSM 23189 = NBRC 102662]
MKTVLLSLIVTACALVSFTPDRQESATPPPTVIAKFDKISNGFIIHEKVLKRSFQDGSKIERFSIEKDGADFFLVRRGIDAKNKYRSEAFRLQAVDKNGLKLILPGKLKWYTVCLAGGCWCHKVGNSCECADGGNCTFGIEPIGDDLEVIVLG